MKKFKIGIVGLSRGRGFVNVFNNHPRVTVSALCDLDENKLADVGEAFKLSDNDLYTNYDEFISSDFDVVVIATPIPFHTEQTLKALESGKHVLCEQTVAYTVDECEKVVGAVKKSGLHYMMAENYCYFHYIQQWKQIINAGKLGEIVYAEAEYLHNIEDLLIDEKTDGRFWRHERPPIWYCAHVVGPLLYLTGDKIVRATGCHTGFNRWPDKTSEPGFLDMEVGLFQTKMGRVFKILRSQTVVHPHIVHYNLYGTKGSVENTRLQRMDKIKDAPGMLYIEDEMGDSRNADIPNYSQVDPHAPEDAKEGGHGTSEYFMIREFLDSLENNVKPPIDVIRAVNILSESVSNEILHMHRLSKAANGWMCRSSTGRS